MMKTSQTYFRNCAMWALQDFLSKFAQFSSMCIKKIKAYLPSIQDIFNKLYFLLLSILSGKPTRTCWKQPKSSPVLRVNRT